MAKNFKSGKLQLTDICMVVFNVLAWGVLLKHPKDINTYSKMFSVNQQKADCRQGN